MDKRVRDRVRRVEKLEIELLSDEEILIEKKEVQVLIEAMQQELLRRIVMLAAFVVVSGICLVGFLANSTPLNLMTVLLSLLIIIAAIVQYTQKYRSLCELFKASDKLSLEN